MPLRTLLLSWIHTANCTISIAYCQSPIYMSHCLYAWPISYKHVPFPINMSHFRILVIQRLSHDISGVSWNFCRGPMKFLWDLCRSREIFVEVPWNFHFSCLEKFFQVTREKLYGCLWVSHEICVTWLIRMADMTHTYVCHESFMCVTCLVKKFMGVSWNFLYMGHDSFIHMCNMTHSYDWHYSYICVSWIIHVCDVSHSSMWYDSLMYVRWLTHVCDMTHSYMRHDSFTCVVAIHKIWAVSHVCMSHGRVACMYESCPCHMYVWVMSHVWITSS